MYFKVSGLNPQKTAPIRFFFWAPSRDENSGKFLRGKFCRITFWIFFKTTTECFSSTSTFHLYILSVHFRVTGEEICWICHNFTALNQFLGVHQRANGRRLTDQSESALYFYCPRGDFAQKAKSRGGTLVTRAYIKESTYRWNVQSVCQKKSRFAWTGAARNR